jgi:hypothetical protein
VALADDGERAEAPAVAPAPATDDKSPALKH